MEERLFISGTSICLLITCLFIRKLLAVADSTCCMQSVTTHNASSAPTHLDDESVTDKRKEDYLALAVHGIAVIGSRTES